RFAVRRSNRASARVSMRFPPRVPNRAGSRVSVGFPMRVGVRALGNRRALEAEAHAVRFFRHTVGAFEEESLSCRRKTIALRPERHTQNLTRRKALQGFGQNPLRANGARRALRRGRRRRTGKSACSTRSIECAEV